MNKNLGKIEVRLRRNIILDYFSVFIANLNMQSSIWVLYLAHCGMNLAQIGLLEGIYHLMSILCEVPSGAMADLIGRKRSMIVSRICIALSCMIMLFSTGFWWFALSFVVQALGNNCNSGSEEALVYDSMKAIGKEEAYPGVCGRLNVVLEVSQGIATVAGGILAEVSYVWCYVACLVIALLAFVPVLLMKEAPYKKEDKKHMQVTTLVRDHFKTCFGVLKSDVRILRIVVFYSVMFAVHTLLFFYSQQYFYDLGYNKIQISLLMLFYSGFCCLGALASEKLYVRFGAKATICSALLIAISLVCYGLENPWVSIIVLSLAGFCNSVLYPIQSDSLNKIIPSEQRATIISVNSMAFSIVMIVVFPIVGAVADYVGLTRVLVVLGVLILVYVLSSVKR